MKNNLSLSIALLILFKLNTALASSSAISIATPSYGGSGCPQGTMSTSLSPDGKTMSLIFDNFIVTAGDNTHRKFTQKNCIINIPITIAAGYQLALLKMDYRGYNQLACGAQSTLKMAYQMEGHKTNEYKKIFYGKIEGDNYLIQHYINSSKIQWSQCSKKVNFKTFINLSVTTNDKYSLTEASIDSNDIASKNNHRQLEEVITKAAPKKSNLRRLSSDKPTYTYHLTYRKCP